MAWTDPKTWVTGEIITASDLNANIRDNELYLKQFVLPTGTMTMFAGASAPDGWLLCDGAAVSRSAYSALFALIGTTYGAGNGTTTFNVPDTRSRFPIGVGTGSGLTARALADTGGVETHALSEAELATHNHSVGAHIHDLKTVDYDAPTTSSPAFPMINQLTGSTGSLTTEGASGSTDTGDTGSGDAFDIMNPFLALNFIIKT